MLLGQLQFRNCCSLDDHYTQQSQYPQPLKLTQIQQQLDEDKLLLELSLGEVHSYVWAVTPNSVNTYELPLKKTN